MTKADNLQSWTLGHLNSCRGIIVTGFSLKSFEIVLPDGPAHQQEKHSVWDCGTVYSEPRDQRAQNPIVGMHSSSGLQRVAILD